MDNFLFHSKSLVHVRESMVIESHIARFMCNNLLVIKSDFKLEGYCVFIPPELLINTMSWSLSV